MFRPSGDGGVTGRLSGDEAKLLRALVDPVVELLDDGRRPQAGPATTDDVFDELERMFADSPDSEGDSKEAPKDPVLARLLPDAYSGDPDAAGEFRKYTESSLREAKKYFAQVMLDTLPESGGKIRLTGDQARDWMRALNDIRLMFGVRLEVTEDFEEQMASLDPSDPSVPVFEVYGWLGVVQESLIQALVG